MVPDCLHIAMACVVVICGIAGLFYGWMAIEDTPTIATLNINSLRNEALIHEYKQ